MDEKSNIVPFGKYKGQPVEVLAEDKQYCDWLSAQEWFRERYANVYTLIVNNFAEPTETPEHNALQVRFLDDNFCYRLIRHLNWKPLTDPKDIMLEFAPIRFKDITQIFYLDEIESLIKDTDNYFYSGDGEYPYLGYINEYKKRRITIELLQRMRKVVNRLYDDVKTAKLNFSMKTDFEVNGWDVVLKFNGPNLRRFDRQLDRSRVFNWQDQSIYIELKTALGDDYPSVLRQMKNNSLRRIFGELERRQITVRLPGTKVLLFDQLTTHAITLDQIRAIFAASDFYVVQLSELEQT